jgi:hypothetical protein
MNLGTGEAAQAKTRVAARSLEPAEQALPKTAARSGGVESRHAASETLWFPQPSVPDDVAKKKLRTRLVLDPNHTGPAVRYVSRDSTWLLMRASKDSAASLRNVRAYIDTAGQLVVQ